ncbi:hypothetical protein JMJ77_0011864, partial [Colletotrichum scovillei]
MSNEFYKKVCSIRLAGAGA